MKRFDDRVSRRLEQIVSTLRRLPLFQGLPEEDLQLVGRSVTQSRFHQGQILFLEGDRGDVAYILTSGAVDLVLESLEGVQLTLDRVDEGGYFGEMALLDDEPRSATAIVSRDAEVVTISRHDLLKHLHEHPDTMLNLLRSLSLRVRAADEKIKLLGFLDVAGRLAKTLLELDRPPGKRATIAIRHEQLAGMVGSTRQTVSEILGKWRASGWVITGRGLLVVTDREALEDLAAT